MSAGLIYSIITMPFEADRDDPRWPEITRDCSRWPEMARDGLEMARDGPRWPEMARDGPRFSGLIYSPMAVSTMADELS